MDLQLVKKNSLEVPFRDDFLKFCIVNEMSDEDVEGLEVGGFAGDDFEESLLEDLFLVGYGNWKKR